MLRFIIIGLCVLLTCLAFPLNSTAQDGACTITLEQKVCNPLPPYYLFGDVEDCCGFAPAGHILIRPVVTQPDASWEHVGDSLISTAQYGNHSWVIKRNGQVSLVSESVNVEYKFEAGSVYRIWHTHDFGGGCQSIKWDEFLWTVTGRPDQLNTIWNNTNQYNVLGQRVNLGDIEY